MHLVVKRLVNDSTVVQDHVGLVHVLRVQIGEGVLHPHFVVTIREVLVRMRTSGLLTSLCRHHLLAGLVEQVLQLKRLDEIGVPHQAAVLDANILVLLHDLGDLFSALQEVLRVAVHGCELLHGDLELPPEICSGDWACGIPDHVKAGDGLLTCIGWQCHCRAVWCHQLCSGVGRLTSEDHEVEERVGTQAVGAMHRCATSLPGCQKARNDHVSLVFDDLALPVGRNATHIVVHGRQDWSRLLCDINACEDLGCLGNAWETLSEGLWWQVVQVQVDVVRIRTHTTAFTDLHGHCTADNITRRQVLCRWCIAGHERLALAVAEDAALTTAALGEEAACWEDACGVELHELEILHWESCTRCHGAAITSAGVC
mmetsp:Transcript_2186/g.3675  ORF Transcript_2186/g.3675 Transcript_2186/m.3675 type:complete len:371 (-) Transcript_2186:799-1911(-)